MRWQDAERSTNVDDVRGRRFGGGGMPLRLGGMGGMSLGGLVAIMAITYLLVAALPLLLGRRVRAGGGARADRVADRT